MEVEEGHGLPLGERGGRGAHELRQGEEVRIVRRQGGQRAERRIALGQQDAHALDPGQVQGAAVRRGLFGRLAAQDRGAGRAGRGGGVLGRRAAVQVDDRQRAGRRRRPAGIGDALDPGRLGRVLQEGGQRAGLGHGAAGGQALGREGAQDGARDRAVAEPGERHGAGPQGGDEPGGERDQRVGATAHLGRGQQGAADRACRQEPRAGGRGRPVTSSVVAHEAPPRA